MCYIVYIDGICYCWQLYVLNYTQRLTAFGHKFKNMIQNIIKKVLRKWLKKTVYSIDSPITNNIARFEWVYNSPLHQWRDRIWVVNHYPFKQKEGYDKCLKEYLYK